jgi:hypothetical protein
MAITFCQAGRQLARKRCSKATNSKAVGGTQPRALPSSPYVPCSRTAFVGLSNRAVKRCGNFTFVLPLKEGRFPVRPG